MGIVTCWACSRRVLPRADGTCPQCKNDLESKRQAGEASYALFESLDQVDRADDQKIAEAVMRLTIEGESVASIAQALEHELGMSRDEARAAAKAASRAKSHALEQHEQRQSGGAIGSILGGLFFLGLGIYGSAGGRTIYVGAMVVGGLMLGGGLLRLAWRARGRAH